MNKRKEQDADSNKRLKIRRGDSSSDEDSEQAHFQIQNANSFSRIETVMNSLVTTVQKLVENMKAGQGPDTDSMTSSPRSLQRVAELGPAK